MATTRLQTRRSTPRPQRAHVSLRVLLVLIPVAALALGGTTVLSFMYSPANPAIGSQAIDVYTGGALPAAMGNVTWVEGGSSFAPQAPSWAPVVGAPVGVATAGDLAVIDARTVTSPLSIRVALGNTGALAGGYRYLTLPVQLYQRDAGGRWEPATDASGAPVTTAYLTLDNGAVSVAVGGEHDFYAVTLAAGGSILAGSTLEDATHTLSPTFIITHGFAQ